MCGIKLMTAQKDAGNPLFFMEGSVNSKCYYSDNLLDIWQYLFSMLLFYLMFIQQTEIRLSVLSMT